MTTQAKRVVVIGGGPAGLAAAEVLAEAGHAVTVYDAMPSVGRKFLLAGIGGLNLTHSEDAPDFAARYGTRRAFIAPMLARFDAQALRAWARGLGIETFVGSSGRVFPTGMKAAPLLRAWLHRLRTLGVRFAVRHRWLGWAGDETGGSAENRPTSALTALRFSTPEGEVRLDADAVILALGGASWARLGSDGAWVPWLEARGIPVAPFRPANCGFDVARPQATQPGWSDFFAARFANQPLKSVVIDFSDAHGARHTRAGECMISATGLEGSLIYALAAPLRDTIAAQGRVTLTIDLAPGRSLARLTEDLSRPRGSRSFASHLQSKAGIGGAKAALLREWAPVGMLESPMELAALLKALPVTLGAPRPLGEAISSAGGVPFEALDPQLMVQAAPGLFCCGEMLDWEAPTGGYLLTACFATGRRAGEGATAWLAGHA